MNIETQCHEDRCGWSCKQEIEQRARKSHEQQKLDHVAGVRKLSARKPDAMIAIPTPDRPVVEQVTHS